MTDASITQRSKQMAEDSADLNIKPVSQANGPSHTSHLLFPLASTPISKTLSSISKSNLSLHNRFASISSDAAFISIIASQLISESGKPLPVIANERCGSWYVDPELKAGSAYFKSTDGHWGQWGFSLRRLNLQVLELAGKSGGAVIVDSTRRGKHLPDALSKTIPIWCCVFNRLLFPSSDYSWPHTLHTLPHLISPSERAQILERIPSCVASARELGLDLAALRAQLRGKPLRPVWIARSLGLDAETALQELRQCGDEGRCTPLYLCMASLHHESRVVAERDERYVQGAGDDGEHWSRGLTPDLFWEYREELLDKREDELVGFLEHIIAKGAERGGRGGCTTIKGVPWLEVGAMRDVGCSGGENAVTILLGGEEEMAKMRSSGMRERKAVHRFLCAAGKLGSKNLRKHFPQVMLCIRSALAQGQTIRVCDTGGSDLAVGVALAALCLCSTNDGSVSHGKEPSRGIDKAMIRQRLTWLTSSMHAASPSRATLNAVNEFLMSERHVP